MNELYILTAPATSSDHEILVAMYNLQVFFVVTLIVVLGYFALFSLVKWVLPKWYERPKHD